MKIGLQTSENKLKPNSVNKEPANELQTAKSKRDRWKSSH